jgi:WD40 repeat protein
MRVFRTGLFCLILSAPLLAQNSDIFKLKSRIDLPAGPVQTSFLENEGKLYVVGKKEVKLWDVSADKLVRSYPHDYLPIVPVGLVGRVLDIRNSMVLNPEGTSGLVLLKTDGIGPQSIGMRDLASGKQIGVLQRAGKNARDFSFSADGKLIFASYGEPADSEIVIWNAGTLEVKSAIVVKDLSWYRVTADGEKIFVGQARANKWSGNVIGYDDSDRIELRNAADGKAEKIFRSPGIKFWGLNNSEPLLSSDEKFLVARSKTDVIVWDTTGDGSPSFTVRSRDFKNVRLVELSEDGKFVVTVRGKHAEIHELGTGKPFSDIATGSTGLSYDLLPGNKYFVIRDTGSAMVYDAELGKYLYTLKIKTRHVESENNPILTSEDVEDVEVSPSGKYFLVSGYKEVNIYNIADGKLMQTLADPRTAKYSDGGKLKDDGLNARRADWIGDEDALYVYGKEDRSYTLWETR